MNDMHDERDPRLSHLLSDAVSDVEPQDALAEIRNRTKVTPMSARRPWLFAVGGAVVATAATVAAVAALGGTPQNSADPDPATSRSPTEEPAPTESAEPSEPAEPTEPTAPSEPPEAADTATVPAYFVRDTPQGLRITREFQSVETSNLPEVEAIRLAITGKALDPDYRSLWPSGSGVEAVGASPDDIAVYLTGDLRDRPAGMTQEEAELAVQQVVYTAQAAVGRGRLPVGISLNGEDPDRILGVPASGLTNAAENDVLAMVSVSSLSDGETVSDRFVVSGIANSFEATVPWEVRRGDRVVTEGFATAEGWMDKLYPWTTQVDVSKLAPGTYTFAAMTDDPSGGAEGAGPTEDTKTIIVE